MVKLKTLFLIAIINLFCADLFTQTLVKSKFDKNTFTFELSFENENDYTIFIDKIGAISQVNFGNFNCEPKLWVPDPISDFTVNVFAKSDTSYIMARPLLKIEPGRTKSFTVSVVPEVANACGSWAMDLSALVKFHYGYTFQSAAELIMSQDVEMLSFKVHTDDELQVLLNNTNPAERIKAINELKFSDFDQKTIEAFLLNKLKDKDAGVRSAAALAVKDMKLSSLSDQIVTNLYSTSVESEVETLIRVIGKQKITKGIDPLIGKMINGDIEEAQLITKVLINMESFDVPSKIRYVFLRHNRWATGNEMENEKFSLICNILINYKDKLSVNNLKKILDDMETAPEVKQNILACLASLIDTYEVIQDEFILSFKEEYANFLNDRNSFVRYNSLNLYLATDFDTKSKSKVIKRSLKDSEYQIKCKAAVWAGQLGFDEYAAEIKTLCNLAEGPEYEEMADALIKLREPEE